PIPLCSLLTVRPGSQQHNMSPGVGLPENPNSIRSPRINILHGGGEPGGSTSSTAQPGYEVYLNASSSGVSHSDLLPPPRDGLGAHPPRGPQPADAADPRTLSEHLAEAARSTTLANISPLNS